MDGWIAFLSATLSHVSIAQAAVFSPASVQQSSPTSSPVYALMCFHFTLTALLIKNPVKRPNICPHFVNSSASSATLSFLRVHTDVSTHRRQCGRRDTDGMCLWFGFLERDAWVERKKKKRKVECEYKTPCLHGAKLLEGACGSTSHLHPDVSWEIGLHASWNGN